MTKKKPPDSDDRGEVADTQLQVSLPNGGLKFLISAETLGAVGTHALSDHQSRMLGTILHPAAHNFSADLRQILKAAGPASLAELPQKTHVPVPITLVAAVAAILSALPGTRVGRPPKASTVEALKLAKKIKSNHGVAKIVAAITGEDSDKIRSNLRGIKKRSKKRPH